MLVDELDVPEEVREILRSEGIEELYPPQAEAVEAISSGRNVVVSIPTASGKSLVGYFGVLRAFSRGMRSIYIVPLRALAMEKYEELSRFGCIGMKVALAIGDYDIPPDHLRGADVIVATCEKVDAITRVDPGFISGIGVVVADEIHLITSPDRGPTLEMVLSKIRWLNPEAQIIGLSATIGNPEEVAEWLNASLVVSDFRPIPLHLGVYDGITLQLDDGRAMRVPRDRTVVGNLVRTTVEEGGQVLIFVSQRRHAESLSLTIGRVLERIIPEEEREALREFAAELERMGGLGKDLAKRAERGACFHHAGLTNEMRKTVENAFRRGLLKVIVATPTLAAGINLPARVVILKSFRRFDGWSNQPIPAWEVKQMLGRAGRPGYDPYGIGVIVAENGHWAEFAWENYIFSDVEPIESHLSSPHALRVHALSLIASRLAWDMKTLLRIFSGTFFAHTVGVDAMRDVLEEVLNFLADNGFVSERGGKYHPTPLGERTSHLYLDPLTVMYFRRAYESDHYSDFAVLHLVSLTPDMLPFRAGRREIETLYTYIAAERLYYSTYEVEEDTYFNAVKTAAVLSAWMDERSQDEIKDMFSVYPGDLHGRVQTAEWLIYGMESIAGLFGWRHAGRLRDLRLRVRHGVREDLLPLIAIPGVGRVRARVLHNHGYTDAARVAEATPEEIARLPGMGPKVAKSIVEGARKLVGRRG